VSVQTVNDQTKSGLDADQEKKISESQDDKSLSIDEKSSDLSNENIKDRYECGSCGYVYEPSEGIKKFGIEKGTAFLDLDLTKFRCPVCLGGSEFYQNIGPRFKASGFEENLTYGFGFNRLPSGQKNVLIFGGLAFAAACFLSLYSLR
tara:strand:+ start:2070 stop:2513 length:444 start_codon:yes stop_codon:yes gene_type:complete